MSPERKRAIISWVYPGDKWLDKVNSMSDAQVHVVYMRLLNNKKLVGISSSIQMRTNNQFHI